MIPGIVSAELRETILDYLDTTFSFQDLRVAEALEAFLRDPDHGIFKGPYVSLSLPYRRGEKSESDRWRIPFWTRKISPLRCHRFVSGDRSRRLRPPNRLASRFQGVPKYTRRGK